jgi:hypothetical protein
MDIELEVVILQDGSVAILTRSGNFAQGSQVIADLLAALNSEAEFTNVSKVEQHAHGPDETIWSFEAIHEPH